MFDGNMTNFQNYYQTYKQWFDSNKLDPRYLAPLSTGCNEVPPQKGNNPMYNSMPSFLDGCDCEICNPPKKQTVAGASVNINAPAQPDVPEEQRKFLSRRALETIASKVQKMRDKFKIDFNWQPKTVKEADERIRAGLFTIIDADKKDDVKFPIYWYGISEVWSWRGPDDQADKDGFDAAYEKFVEFYNPILDEIRIFDPKDALKSLRKIEAFEI